MALNMRAHTHTHTGVMFETGSCAEVDEESDVWRDRKWGEERRLR